MWVYKLILFSTQVKCDAIKLFFLFVGTNFGIFSIARAWKNFSATSGKFGKEYEWSQKKERFLLFFFN